MGRFLTGLITGLAFLGLLAAGVWFGAPKVVQAVAAAHTRSVSDHALAAAQGGALTAGTQDAGQVASACLRAAQRARAAGYASAKADDAPPPADGSLGHVDGAEFMNRIGGGQ